MSKELKTDSISVQIDVLLLILRLGVGILMLTHGIPKLQMLFSTDEINFPNIMGLSSVVSLSIAVFAEVV